MVINEGPIHSLVASPTALSRRLGSCLSGCEGTLLLLRLCPLAGSVAGSVVKVRIPDLKKGVNLVPVALEDAPVDVLHVDRPGPLVRTVGFLASPFDPLAISVFKPREVVLVIFGDKLGALLLMAWSLQWCVCPLGAEHKFALLRPSVLKDQ